MNTKELQQELVEYLKKKYSVTGMATAGEVDGCMSSAVSFALNIEKEQKSFKIVLIETHKQFD